MQHAAQRSVGVGADAVEIFQHILPYEVFLEILSYLSLTDLCTAMTVSKVYIAMLYCSHSNYSNVLIIQSQKIISHYLQVLYCNVIL